ncbi:histidine-containing phosphotransfer protein 1-like isoform X2 [Camellia sinensis]|uniref:histidine-containing phosphotransfer protein 1-like isoform X2 n=1 Tax=Camellia sinensis TaxID=4442 RepID=UPI001036C861|nr:histidine-containing phosphotransfer protein 1-like isoform X2 [Camellia sinensis]
MDGIRQLQRQLHNFPLSRGQYISQSCRDIYTTPLYREGLLDDQFRELQKLEDESNPEFVVEIVLLFFQVSEKLLNNLTSSLQEQIVDYKQVDAHVYQFKGSSSSIGAPRVKNMCVALGNYCDEKNLEGYQLSPLGWNIAKYGWKMLKQPEQTALVWKIC